MKDFQTILQRKINYYGKTEAAYEFAAEEYATRKMIDENLSMLKMTKLEPMIRVAVLRLPITWSYIQVGLMKNQPVIKAPNPNLLYSVC